MSTLSTSRTVLYEHELFISTKLKVGSISILNSVHERKIIMTNFLWKYLKNHWKEKTWSYLSLLKAALLNAIHLFSNWKYNDSRKFPLWITTEFFSTGTSLSGKAAEMLRLHWFFPKPKLLHGYCNYLWPNTGKGHIHARMTKWQHLIIFQIYLP